jgi:hypothetical protein
MKKTVFAIKLRSSNRVADIVALVKILVAIALLLAAVGGLQYLYCEKGTVKECLIAPNSRAEKRQVHPPRF